MKKNFDDIIRQRLESRVYPVDPNHRDDMAKLLEGKKRRGGIIFWWLGGAAMFLVAGLLFYQSNADEISTQKADVDSITQREATPQVKAAKENSLHSETTPEVETQTESNTSADDNAISKAEPRKAAIQAKASGVSTPGREHLKSTSAGNKAKSSTNSKSTLSGNTEFSVNEKPVGISEKIVNSTIQNQNTGKESDIKKDHQQLVENKKEGVQNEPFFKVELENPNEARIVSETASINVFADSVQYDPWTGHIYDGIHRYPTVTDPIAMLEMDWEIERNQPDAGTIKPVLRHAHPVYLLGEAGFGLVLGSRPEYASGTKWNFGGGLGMQLAPRIHLQLTGGYMMQDGGFAFERMSTVNQFDFGVRSEFNSLKPDRLHYAYGKLGFAYRVNKSVFNVHMGAQYLYGAQGTISVYEVVSVGEPVAPRESRAWLSTDGLRKMQVFSDVSYGYRLIPSLYLQGGVTMYYSSLAETDTSEDYYWTGKTAPLQPFITLNYLIHGK